MGLERTQLTAGMPDRRLAARRAADKIAQLYLTREQLRSSHGDWVASALQYARAYPLAAIAAALAAGYMLSSLAHRARSG